MKRIVILCDGTWNRSDSLTPTNVVRLAQALEPISSDGIVQVPIYIQGVGTGKGSTRISREADRWLGGALGWGLLANIEEAYRHLVFLFEPDDEIYIFGFSRGAYTARSLTGLIRSTGIVRRDDLHLVPEAMTRYRTLDDDSTHPNTEESHAFRARVSPRVVTSEKEAVWRRQNNVDEAPLLRITYLGVWDSVGALGIPEFVPLLSKVMNQGYRFHDARLSSMVASARHAVALDERRRAYKPTLWANVGELNKEAAAPKERPYREEYFAGDHGSVGGGGEIVQLSSIALRWMMEGAMAAGLEFDANRLEEIRNAEEPGGPLRNHTRTASIWSGLASPILSRDRDGPETMAQLHPSVLTRWRGESKREMPSYRPGSLKRVHQQLVDWYRAEVGHDPPDL